MEIDGSGNVGGRGYYEVLVWFVYIFLGWGLFFERCMLLGLEENMLRKGLIFWVIKVFFKGVEFR